MSKDKEKHNQKIKERGITLIALIITIIVLLILAGVALASLFGDNGILNNAETAKLQTNHSSVAEGIKLKMGEYQIAKNVEGYSEDFITYLKEYENGAIVDNDGVIDVKNLLGKKLSTGNGTGLVDVYKLEEVIESAKLASTEKIKIAETTNTKGYILKYYHSEENFVQIEILGNALNVGAEGDENEDEVLTAPEVYAYSFKAGDDITVYVVENAEATATQGTKVYDMFFIGTGEMNSMEYWNTDIVNTDFQCDFADYNIYIENAKISNGITNISYAAFYKSSLKNITIPSSVSSIDGKAFYNCTSLASITIPSSVTSIGSYAFYNCDTLASITIPSSVTRIDAYAFMGCDGLTDIKIPSSVNTIAGSAFNNCSNLTNISVDENNSVYDSRENCNAIIETSTNELIVGCKNTVIPSTITKIGKRAFWFCTGLEEIIIPNSVTEIAGSDSTGYRDAGAFCGCSNLKTITVSKSVKSIGNYVFYSCTNLETVNYTGSSEEWAAITISSYGNTPLTSLTPNYNYTETAE